MTNDESSLSDDPLSPRPVVAKQGKVSLVSALRLATQCSDSPPSLLLRTDPCGPVLWTYFESNDVFWFTILWMTICLQAGNLYFAVCWACTSLFNFPQFLRTYLHGLVISFHQIQNTDWWKWLFYQQMGQNVVNIKHWVTFTVFMPKGNLAKNVFKASLQ